MLNNAMIAEITAFGAPSQTRVFDSRSYLRITASTSVSTSTDSISCASSSFSASVSGDFLLFLKTTEAFSFRLVIKGDLLFQKILGTQNTLANQSNVERLEQANRASNPNVRLPRANVERAGSGPDPRRHLSDMELKDANRPRERISKKCLIEAKNSPSRERVFLDTTGRGGTTPSRPVSCALSSVMPIRRNYAAVTVLPFSA